MSTSFKLSLPVDIPWKRKCVSEDMIDPKLCDKKSPFRWRSSIAIFDFEPDDEYQQHEGVTISYLKVVCTITGYQETPEEIGLKNRWLKNYWKDQPGIENYVDVLQKYYPCYGAILEVTVGPSKTETPIKNFPYFMDFEPKRRELYEVATDTKERQSRSLESLNITKSSANTQSLEVFDVDMGGGGHSQQGSFAGTGGGYSIQNPNGQWGTKRINAEESLGSRSADVGEEKRTTFSFSTQVSQLYHLLDSYHLGTNRAVFFMLNRPHTKESEHTFVNGLRSIEGVQEFFLVVARPKGTAPVCVEAYLETGHIAKVPRVELEEVPGSEMKTSWSGEYQARPKGDDDPTTVFDAADRLWEVNTYHAGYKIKNANLSSPGPKIRYNYDKPNLVDVHPHISLLNEDLIRVSGKVHSGFANYAIDSDRWEEISYPFTVDITLVKMRTAEKSTDTLFITGRNLCCCERPRPLVIDGVVYERGIKWETDVMIRERVGPGMPIAAANRMGEQFKTALQRSRADLENRYASAIRLQHTDFAAAALRASVNATEFKLRDVSGLSDQLSKKLRQLRRSVTVNEMLAMPFRMQQELFSLSEGEVTELREALSGLKHRVDDPKQAWLSAADVTKLFGRGDEERTH